MAEGEQIDVLVVEDEQQVAELLAEVLSGEGYRVATAADGLKALAEVARLRPRLLLLDVMLPGLSGMDVLRRLQATDESGPAVILMSAAAAPPGRPAHVPFLPKPFNIDDLLNHVEAAL
jgi:DNA-binding response OmpR family regulator